MNVRWLGTGESALPTWVYNDSTVRVGRQFEVIEDAHSGWDGRVYYTLAHGDDDSFEMPVEHFEVVEK